MNKIKIDIITGSGEDFVNLELGELSDLALWALWGDCCWSLSNISSSVVARERWLKALIARILLLNWIEKVT
jgi:hypothetical protein